jgi:C-terminal processing protease CtpA/Prc
MTKCTTIISQVKKHHWLDNNITTIVNDLDDNITKFMDKEECKNFLVTMYNMSPHSFISMEFSSDCDHLFHEECGNSFTNIDQC